MGRLDGKTAIVTGGAGGIGSATCRRLIEDGAQVVVADVEFEPAEALARELGEGASAVKLDLSSADSIQQTFDGVMKSHGRIDVLDNNAALVNEVIFANDRKVAEMDPDVLDAMYEVNVRGTALAAKYAIPHMIASGGGVIINISSVSAVSSDVSHVGYAVTKAALYALTQAIATQYGKAGIRSVAVTPGMILTERTRMNQSAEHIESMVRHHLTPYAGEPEDIANLVAFLASDEAKYITGTNIMCEGGLTAHLPHFADHLPS
jgi:NAD(P)-dependent dehydrogenase (short-subunit alcohol dehydrogenase family)